MSNNVSVKSLKVGGGFQPTLKGLSGSFFIISFALHIIGNTFYSVFVTSTGFDTEVTRSRKKEKRRRKKKERKRIVLVILFSAA